MSLQPGQTILNNKYRIERLLGSGAFGEVYLATHRLLNAPVAIKVLRRDAAGVGSAEFGRFRERFLQEAQLGKRLNHPNVVRVDDFSEDAGVLYLVMEFCAGGSLADRLATDRPLAVDEAVRIALDVAQGLAALHALDAVHRDLKPSNILFDGPGRARVGDLGLAQAPGSPSRPSLLGSQARPQPGTPDYMSPEQAANAPRLTPSSDIYSLGAVLFEMLTGRLYRNQRPGARAKSLRTDVPAWLDDLIARMLAEKPEDRPWDGAEVAGLLATGQRIAQEKAEAEAKAEAAEQARWAAALRVQAQQEAEERASREAAAPRPPRSEVAASPAGRKRPVGWILLTLGLVAVIIWVVAQRGPTPAAPEPTALPVVTQAPELTKAPAFTQAPTAAPPTKVPEPTKAPEPSQAPEPTTTLAPTKVRALPEPTSAVSQTPAGSTLSLELAPGVILELVRVPAGEFLMGSDKAQDPLAIDDELPQHRVTLPEYWIGKTEVTVAQFAAFVAATGYKTTAEKTGSGYIWIGNTWEDVKGADWAHPRGPGSDVQAKANHPVTLVSWDDAVAFARWASDMTGRAIKLPTEAEWEKAARGADGGLYPWGNAAPDAQRCNFAMQVGDTTPVGQYPAGASPYGALDMAGNVWEWTSSLYQAYPYQGGDGREDPNDRGPRVLRGGSFGYVSLYVRCAVRDRFNPEGRYVGFGFRVVSPGL